MIFAMRKRGLFVKFAKIFERWNPNVVWICNPDSVNIRILNPIMYLSIVYIINVISALQMLIFKPFGL